MKRNDFYFDLLLFAITSQYCNRYGKNETVVVQAVFRYPNVQKKYLRDQLQLIWCPGRPTLLVLLVAYKKIQ